MKVHLVNKSFLLFGALDTSIVLRLPKVSVPIYVFNSYIRNQ